MTDNDLSGHAHSKISSGLNEVTNNDDQTDSERLNSLDTFQNIVRRSITNISHNGIPTEEIVDDDNVDDDDDEAIGYSFFVHRHYEIILPNGQKRAYRLNMLQRVFVMMDDPKSCLLAGIYSQFMMAVILMSIISYVASTSPEFQYQPDYCLRPVCHDAELCPGDRVCAPTNHDVFMIVNLVAQIIFTLDFGGRSFVAPIVPTRLTGIVGDQWDENEALAALEQDREPMKDPHFSWHFQFLVYMFSFYGIVDFLAIVPNYFFTSGDATSYFRVFRLLRTFKMVKYFAEPLAVIRLTLSDSREVLVILAFCFIVSLVFFGCLMFAAEQGVFMVSDYTVSMGYPRGAFVRLSPDDMGQTISPFNSIVSSMYWAVITITTVGFGDIYPTTRGGRAVAAVAAICGIFVIALPVAVVGNNFSREYELYRARVRLERERKKAALLRRSQQHKTRLAKLLVGKPAKPGSQSPGASPDRDYDGLANASPLDKHGSKTSGSLSPRGQNVDNKADAYSVELAPLIKPKPPSNSGNKHKKGIRFAQVGVETVEDLTAAADGKLMHEQSHLPVPLTEEDVLMLSTIVKKISSPDFSLSELPGAEAGLELALKKLVAAYLADKEELHACRTKAFKTRSFLSTPFPVLSTSQSHSQNTGSPSHYD